jgi:hypothetical protein
MIFIIKSINPVIIKINEYTSYVNTCLHKKFCTVLMFLNLLINLSMFNMPFIN